MLVVIFCSLVKQFVFMNLFFIWRSFVIDASFSFRQVLGDSDGGGDCDGDDNLLYNHILYGEVSSL
jgi:hypothetical protein